MNKLQIDKAIQVMKDHKKTCEMGCEDKYINELILAGNLKSQHVEEFRKFEKEQAESYETAIKALNKLKFGR